MASPVGTPGPKLSAHAIKLTGEARQRYLDKISIISAYDPFLGAPKEAASVVPPVDALDLVSYLVLETSFYTKEQFKARKGLEAHNQFTSGWIKEIKSFCLHDLHVTTA